MNKAILLINSTSSIGGAQKRYINLFNYVNSQRDDYFLIINRSLFEEAYKNNILQTKNNVKIVAIKKRTNISEKKSINTNLNNIKKRIQKQHIFKQFKRFIWLVRIFMNWLKFIHQSRMIIKDNEIKVIYSVWLGGVWVWPLKYLLKFKLIHSYNDSSLSSLSRSIYRIFDSEYWVLKYCDKIDFLSAGIIPRLEQKTGLDLKKKKLVSSNSFINYKNYYPLYPKKNNIIFMSRLTKIKNPILFLESIIICNNINLNVDFYILGRGVLEDEIKKSIVKNRLCNVHFVGAVYKPWKYLRRSKIFISIQRDNNYPSQSILEAMACENAIIASDVGETRKLITKEEGILVSLDAKEIAKAIEKLVDNSGLTERLGKNARIKAMKEHNIDKYSKYFYKIMGK